ncbi:MAG: MoaD/ThiS family protein [Sulfolobales archaeon]
MRVKIRLYAVLRDLYGASEDLLEFNRDRISVRELLEIIASRNDSLKKFITSRGESILTLVNGVYASLEQDLRDGDVVDILPPASGGFIE